MAGFFLTRYLRALVSKNHRRLVTAGYDLDLSYITDRIIATSYPAERYDSLYRNPMSQVRRFLDSKHGDHYKVYNLCEELSYESSCFYGRTERFPSDDHHVPPLFMVQRFCESLDAWLNANPDNVAAIHCRAGKGRTGVMVCAYLVYTGMAPEEALSMYARKRTVNQKGVTIASQRRYVRYIEKLPRVLKQDGFLNAAQAERSASSDMLRAPEGRPLRRIRLYDVTGAEKLDFALFHLRPPVGEGREMEYWPAEEIFSGQCCLGRRGHQRTMTPRFFKSALQAVQPLELSEGDSSDGDAPPPGEARWAVQMDTDMAPEPSRKRRHLDCYFKEALPVSGDIRLVCREPGGGGRLFTACFHSAFIPSGGIVQLGRSELDKLSKKAKNLCGPNFSVELLFAPASEPSSPKSVVTVQAAARIVPEATPALQRFDSF